jgi:hypothetical protein
MLSVELSGQPRSPTHSATTYLPNDQGNEMYWLTTFHSHHFTSVSLVRGAVQDFVVDRNTKTNRVRLFAAGAEPNRRSCDWPPHTLDCIQITRSDATSKRYDRTGAVVVPTLLPRSNDPTGTVDD